MKNICKDLLYFKEKDKRAILLLLILILVTCIATIYINNFSTIDPEYFRKQNTLVSEFTFYENNTEDKEFITDSDINDSASAGTSVFKERVKPIAKLNNGQLININTASHSQLMRIPGIGKTLAERIVEYRNKEGRFENTEQLTKVKGINNNKLSKILPYIILSTTADTKTKKL